MATPKEYRDSVIGKAFDMDGVFGVQCVDAFKHFCKTQLGLDISLKSICNPTGFATSIWDNYESLGLNQYFDKVAINEMVDGDWAIWKMGSRDCGTSHVAMFRWDNKDGTGCFLGQNQFGKRSFSEGNIHYEGIRGALRPKIYHVKPVEPEKPKHPTYITLGDMYVRTGAGPSYAAKKVKDLTADGKKHATSTNANADAVYKKGTVFSALEIINENGIWAKTPSGYVCIQGASGKIYSEKSE